MKKKGRYIPIKLNKGEKVSDLVHIRKLVSAPLKKEEPSEFENFQIETDEFFKEIEKKLTRDGRRTTIILIIMNIIVFYFLLKRF